MSRFFVACLGKVSLQSLIAQIAASWVGFGLIARDDFLFIALCFRALTSNAVFVISLGLPGSNDESFGASVYSSSNVG